MSDRTTNTGAVSPERPASCPAWCTTDHHLEHIEHELRASAAHQELEAHREFYDVVIGPASSTEPAPADTCLVHRAIVGRVLVDVGTTGNGGELAVVLEQFEEPSDPEPAGPVRVRMDEPHGWTGDYAPEQAAQLAPLLTAAATLARTA